MRGPAGGWPEQTAGGLRGAKPPGLGVRGLPPGLTQLTAELGQGALGFGEPGPPRGQRLLRLLLSAGVAAGLRARDLAFQLADRGPDLLHRSPRPLQGLRIRPAPVRVLGPANGLLDPP